MGWTAAVLLAALILAILAARESMKSSPKKKEDALPEEPDAGEKEARNGKVKKHKGR
ncbi:hypothetical protein [Oxalicibacterium flavum]|uniref:hypothetical protein n=1 Tax=Oxalicibacterium flavum TaxID=179467 RepID=UPI00166955B2|nr:hypothetical protein [Oxalicibacterium flavum]